MGNVHSLFVTLGAVAVVEELVLEELRMVVQAYAQDSAPRTMFEVLIVPQDDRHRQEIFRLLGTEPLRRSGGLAFVAGTYFSDMIQYPRCGPFACDEFPLFMRGGTA